MNEPGICPDKEDLVSYLYGEGDAGERARVEQHAASCTRCSLEIGELGAVRQKLVAWTPPEVDLGFRVVREVPAPRPWWAWARVPAMVQAAAVVLLLAGAVAVANLEVRYGPEGLVVRTGWSGPASPEQSAPSSPAQIEAPWRAELASL
jgi:anti-sigma factor RsiW